MKLVTSSDSRLISKQQCPLCADIGKDTTGNGLAVYDDGHTYCFKCDTHSQSGDSNMESSYNPSPPPTGTISPKGTARVALTDRRISADICSKYGVTVSFNEGGKVAKHYYPYFNSEDQLIGYKERTLEDKHFTISGTNKGSQLFGQQVSREGGKYLTITEGEIDCLSVSEMFDGKFFTSFVISLCNGINRFSS